jgi:hypothetical protein
VRTQAGDGHPSVPGSGNGNEAPAAHTPVPGARAAALEAQGHDLLESGRYVGAVRVLASAVAATGERLGACVEPSDERCLTYAYALYDLGRALQLSGDAAAAVPVLRRRLEIDNQRATVQAELRRASVQAGGRSSG